MGTVDDLWAETLPLTSRMTGVILDAGCGNGEYACKLKEFPGITTVVALDLRGSGDSCYDRRLRERNLDGCEFVQGDVQCLPFPDDEFDGVFCWRVLQYVSKPYATLAEFARVTKSGGFVEIRVPSGPRGQAPPNLAKEAPEGHPAKLRPDAFTWRTFWCASDWVEAGRMVGLQPAVPWMMDRSESQVHLFTVVK